MKKIPTLFERIFENHRIVGITSDYDSKFEWVFKGEGKATRKYDGSCCAIINGVFYKRYDSKGKNPPENGIECSPADPITGHHPFWIPVDYAAPGNKYYIEAFENAVKEHGVLEDGTYEAVGPKFNKNKDNFNIHTLVRHGMDVLEVDRTFKGIKDFLESHYIEGIVFWKDNEPQVKIKRSDFGFKW